jgi:hypothetical protein
MKLRPLNVRTRLTLWYLAVLAAALLIYGASTSLFLVFQLRSQLDHRAIEDLETIKGLLSSLPTENYSTIHPDFVAGNCLATGYLWASFSGAMGRRTI